MRWTLPAICRRNTIDKTTDVSASDHGRHKSRRAHFVFGRGRVIQAPGPIQSVREFPVRNDRSVAVDYVGAWELPNRELLEEFAPGTAFRRRCVDADGKSQLLILRGLFHVLDLQGR